MIECNQIKNLLDEFYNQTLTINEEKELFNHITNCKECKNEFHNDAKLIKILNISSVLVEPKIDISKNIIKKVKTRNLPFKFAAAAVIVLLIGILFFIKPPKHNESIITAKKSTAKSIHKNIFYTLYGDSFEIMKNNVPIDCKNNASVEPNFDVYSFNNTSISNNFLKISLKQNSNIKVCKKNIHFIFGHAHFDFKKLHSKFKVSTIYSDIFITGTSFSLFRNNINTSSITFCLDEGSVEIIHKNGSTMTVKAPAKIQFLPNKLIDLNHRKNSKKSKLNNKSKNKSISLE